MCGPRGWNLGVEREKSMGKALVAAFLLLAQAVDDGVTLDGCEFVGTEGGKVWIACPEPSSDDSGRCEKLAEEEWSCRA